MGIRSVLCMTKRTRTGSSGDQTQSSISLRQPTIIFMTMTIITMATATVMTTTATVMATTATLMTTTATLMATTATLMATRLTIIISTGVRESPAHPRVSSVPRSVMWRNTFMVPEPRTVPRRRPKRLGPSRGSLTSIERLSTANMLAVPSEFPTSVSAVYSGRQGASCGETHSWCRSRERYQEGDPRDWDRAEDLYKYRETFNREYASRTK